MSLISRPPAFPARADPIPIVRAKTASAHRSRPLSHRSVLPSALNSYTFSGNGAASAEASSYREGSCVIGEADPGGGGREMPLPVPDALCGSRVGLCKRPATAAPAALVESTLRARRVDRPRAEPSITPPGPLDPEDQVPKNHSAKATKCDHMQEEDDEPANFSEVIRTRITQTRAMVPSTDTFFDDISGWSEAMDDENMTNMLGGSSYSYLTCDLLNRDTEEPDAELLQRMRRLTMRKRRVRSSMRQGSGGNPATPVSRSNPGCSGEDDESGVENQQQDQPVSGHERGGGPSKMAEKRLPILDTEATCCTATGNKRPPSSIPCTQRLNIPGDEVQHVPLNAAMGMVPHMSDRRRPATSFGSRTVCESPSSNAQKPPRSSYEPSVYPAASENMAKLRRKLLSSARTNNRSVGTYTSPSAQSSDDGFTRPNSSTPQSLPMGFTVLTGKKCCSSPSLGTSHDPPSSQQIWRSSSARRWRSSSSLSATGSPSSMSARPPSPSAALLQPAPNPLTLPHIPIPLHSKSSIISQEIILTADQQPKPQSSRRCTHLNGVDSTSDLSYSCLSPPAPAEIPKWFAERGPSDQQHRSATLDRFALSLHVKAPMAAAIANTTGAPVEFATLSKSSPGDEKFTMGLNGNAPFAALTYGKQRHTAMNAVSNINSAAIPPTMLLKRRSFRDQIDLTRTSSRQCV